MAFAPLRRADPRGEFHRAREYVRSLGFSDAQMETPRLRRIIAEAALYQLDMGRIDAPRRMRAPAPIMANPAPFTFRQMAQLSLARFRAFRIELALDIEDARQGNPSKAHISRTKTITNAAEFAVCLFIQIGAQEIACNLGLWDAGYVTLLANETRKEVSKGLLGAPLPSIEDDVSTKEGASFYALQFLAFNLIKTALGTADGVTLAIVNMPSVKRALIKSPLFQSFLRSGTQFCMTKLKSFMASLPKTLIKNYLQREVRQGALGIIHDLIVKGIPFEVILENLHHNLETTIRSLKSQSHELKEKGVDTLLEIEALFRDVQDLIHHVCHGERVGEENPAQKLRNLLDKYYSLRSTSPRGLLDNCSSSILFGARHMEASEEIPKVNALMKIIGDLELMRLAPTLSNTLTVLNDSPSGIRMSIAILGGITSAAVGYPLLGGIATLGITQLVSYEADDNSSFKHHPTIVRIMNEIQIQALRETEHAATYLRERGYKQAEINLLASYAQEFLAGSILLMINDISSPLLNAIVNGRMRESISRLFHKLGVASSVSTQLATESFGPGMIPYKVAMGIIHQIASSYVEHPVLKSLINLSAIFFTSTSFQRVLHKNPLYQKHIAKVLLNGIPERKTKVALTRLLSDLKRVEKLLPERLQLASKTVTWIKRSATVGATGVIIHEFVTLAQTHSASDYGKWAITHSARAYSMTVVHAMISSHIPQIVSAACTALMAPRIVIWEGYSTKRAFPRFSKLNLISNSAAMAVNTGVMLYTNNLYISVIAATATDAFIRSNKPRIVKDATVAIVKEGARRGRRGCNNALRVVISATTRATATIFARVLPIAHLAQNLLGKTLGLKMAVQFM
ncbi:MAG: hypothetical protein P0S95_03290 [Rhabdochlamydiaceae bacterium]|nr:hypothetical protein [Candidatus Amphrikana amoebophyrae]